MTPLDGGEALNSIRPNGDRQLCLLDSTLVHMGSTGVEGGASNDYSKGGNRRKHKP